MEENLPPMNWPKRGNKAFIASVNPRSPTRADLEWLKFMSGDFLSMAFKEAGDKVVKDLEAGNEMKHADMYFFLYVIFYRHCIELELKAIVELGIKLGILPDDDKHKKLLGSHSLCRLWTKSAVALKEVYPDDPPEDLHAAGGLIQQFHELDQTGQSFRYSKTKKGERTLQNAPESVDLANLRDTFDGLYNFLTAVQGGLGEALGNVDY